MTKTRKIRQNSICTKINFLKEKTAVSKLFKTVLKYLILRYFVNNFTLVWLKIFAPTIINKKKNQLLAGVTSHLVTTYTLCNTDTLCNKPLLHFVMNF